MARIARMDGEVRVDCMHLDPGGVVGFHQAASNQLFIVVRGEGWVRSTDDTRLYIEAGDAVFWKEGEWHESGTGAGMVVIVLEGPSVDPAGIMPEG